VVGEGFLVVGAGTFDKCVVRRGVLTVSLVCRFCFLVLVDMFWDWGGAFFFVVNMMGGSKTGFCPGRLCFVNFVLSVSRTLEPVHSLCGFSSLERGERNVLEKMLPGGLVLRTLDVGCSVPSSWCDSCFRSCRYWRGGGKPCDGGVGL